MKKIQIIEDDKALREELRYLLENNGYQVFLVTEFENTIIQMKETPSDLILLDINIPGVNGEYLCKEYRKEFGTPIIMVTSRNNEMDELLCINYGADDYITKPYNGQILLARIESILRRSVGQNMTLTYESISLNVSKSIIESEHEIIDLSKNELKIFYYLLKNRGKIVSREEIMSYLWDSEEFVDDNTLTVNINRLRKKLDEVGLVEAIETKRGQGYLLV